MGWQIQVTEILSLKQVSNEELETYVARGEDNTFLIMNMAPKLSK